MVDAKRLNEWISAISTTEDEEIDCDALFEVVQAVVDAAASGGDVREILPHVALHLDHCPDCRDHDEAVMAFVEAENA